jgi:hypothetical protein
MINRAMQPTMIASPQGWRWLVRQECATYSPDLLEDKTAQLKLGSYDTLSGADKNKIIDSVEQEYLAYLFLNNSNAKMHSQLQKDVVNDYFKGNTDAYPNDIHKALTLMNEYKPLKLDTLAVPVQGTAFVTNNQGGKKKGKGKTKYLKDTEWNALSPEAQSKIIEACKKGKDEEEDEKFVASNKSSKTIKSLSKTMKSLEKDNRRLKKLVSALQKCNEDEESLLSSEEDSSSEEGTSHFQDAMEMLEEYHPKVVLALRSSKSTNLDLRNVLLLDNQSTFDLCCNSLFYPR